MDSPTASIARSSTARFLADIGSLLFGLGGSIVTARLLGPAGKGDYATIILLVGLVGSTASLGLTDAAVILVGKGAFSFPRAIQHSIALLVISIPIGIALFVAIAALQFSLNVNSALIAAGAAATGLGALSTFTNSVPNAEDRVVFTSSLFALTSALAFVFQAIALIAFRATAAIAVYGALAGSLIACLVAMANLAVRGALPLPKLSLDYTKAALPHGLRLQTSTLLMGLGSRVDLLIVHAISTSALAGSYSIALTLGQMGVYPAFALSLATYPRLARVGPPEARSLLILSAKTALITSGVLSLLMASLAAPMILVIFGRDFSPAVLPSIVLAMGACIWALQWLLCRAWAARGESDLIVKSFLVSLVSMVVLDLVLIPKLELLGASVASVAGPVCGLIPVSFRLSTSPFGHLRWTDFRPTWADVRSTKQVATDALFPNQGRKGKEHPPSAGA